MLVPYYASITINALTEETPFIKKNVRVTRVHMYHVAANFEMKGVAGDVIYDQTNYTSKIGDNYHYDVDLVNPITFNNAHATNNMSLYITGHYEV